MKTDLDRTELRELYRIAIEEYRFQVKLNWDRMQYYLVLNLGVIGVGTTLLRQDRTDITLLLVGLIFGAGFLSAIVGILSIRRERKYYLNTIYKKTLIEELLGLRHQIEGSSSELANLCLATTRGMSRSQEILEDPIRWMKRSVVPRDSSVFYVISLLSLLALIDVIAAVIIAGRLVYIAVRHFI